ncbi:unnamed protein product [Amoebophrya sp. A25]|nr:unnamed protein product [Amoebophrya sp. A25]|eukprot:GSA25T00003898001.1
MGNKGSLPERPDLVSGSSAVSATGSLPSGGGPGAGGRAASSAAKQAAAATKANAKDSGVTPPSIEHQIRQLLRNYLPPGVDRNKITREQYHIGMTLSHEVGLNMVAHTPLGDRLYSLLERRGNGAVTEENLVKVLTMLYCGSEADRLDLTLNCYDSTGAGFVLREELLQTFTESWICAFRTLSQKLDIQRASELELPSHHDLANFANKSKDKFRAKVERAVDQSGAFGNVIIRDHFFVLMGSGNTDVTASVGPDTVCIITGFKNVQGGGAKGVSASSDHAASVDYAAATSTRRSNSGPNYGGPGMNQNLQMQQQQTQASGPQNEMQSHQGQGQQAPGQQQQRQGMPMQQNRRPHQGGMQPGPMQQRGHPAPGGYANPNPPGLPHLQVQPGQQDPMMIQQPQMMGPQTFRLR